MTNRNRAEEKYPQQAQYLQNPRKHSILSVAACFPKPIAAKSKKNYLCSTAIFAAIAAKYPLCAFVSPP